VGGAGVARQLRERSRTYKHSARSVSMLRWKGQLVAVGTGATNRDEPGLDAGGNARAARAERKCAVPKASRAAGDRGGCARLRIPRGPRDECEAHAVIVADCTCATALSAKGDWASCPSTRAMRGAACDRRASQRANRTASQHRADLAARSDQSEEARGTWAANKSLPPIEAAEERKFRAVVPRAAAYACGSL